MAHLLPIRTRSAAAIVVVVLNAIALSGHAAAPRTRNVFLITTDGLRWQEVFSGAEEALLNDKSATGNPERMKQLFWKATPEERRRTLLPFFWSELAKHGQLYGNQLKGSECRVTNGKNFSYPGYNEFLTGAADSRITNNAATPNPNTNVFEWLNTRPARHGKVAAVVNWNVIPWILNTPRSQLPVWSGYAPPRGAPVITAPQLLEDISQDITPVFSDIIFDAFTIHTALDYVERQRPRAFYLAFGETDEWAHEGKYDRYLIAARRVDRFIHELWETCQSLPQYRDKTTFIITTDHGRGSGPSEWKGHGEKIAGSENTWVAILGPDTPPLGERERCCPIAASQIATTVAAFLGEDFRQCSPRAAMPIIEAFQH
ncbi:MAG TPA: alkaline phosphatase family protein [Verrucomicrobiae bacterium]